MGCLSHIHRSQGLLLLWRTWGFVWQWHSGLLTLAFPFEPIIWSVLIMDYVVVYACVCVPAPVNLYILQCPSEWLFQAVRMRSLLLHSLNEIKTTLLHQCINILNRVNSSSSTHALKYHGSGIERRPTCPRCCDWNKTAGRCYWNEAGEQEDDEDAS